MQIVWFKRDLRIEDHAALSLAAATGRPILPLYILEPDLWRQPDMSHRHYAFLKESLIELDEALRAIGQSLIIRVGEAVQILDHLADHFPIEGLWSHQETGNAWTYDRDKRVAAWAQKRGVAWHEPVQNGVIRRLTDRNGWARHWQDLMMRPCYRPPSVVPSIALSSEPLPDAQHLGLAADGCLYRQQGGRKVGLELLQTFLYQRGEAYTKQMSSPVTAYRSCSLLSPHIAFGTLSIREIFQSVQRRQAELAAVSRGERGSWPSAMRSFSARLYWHCHFIQKLEDEPSIEFRNFHSAYDGLREETVDQAFFEAWEQGKTGYPMIDACMRALKATGWLNFRMRAMVMSFASYHLWLHWRPTALYLARLFTDYEPGIHYAQAQMQSGTTGINAIRIYNPIKQGIDHDPEGVFIRHWVPELADMPLEALHMPWTMPTRMNGYPMPIIDEKLARKNAADKLYGLRKALSHKREAVQIADKHGSRKSGVSAKSRKKTKKDDKQGLLPL